MINKNKHKTITKNNSLFKLKAKKYDIITKVKGGNPNDGKTN